MQLFHKFPRIEVFMEFLSRLPFRRNGAVVALVMLPILPVQAQDLDITIFQRYRAMDSAVEKATKEVEAHHFDDAKKLLEPVLKEIPDHVGAQFLLARMAYESRDFAVSLNHIETGERSLKNLDQRYAKLMEDMKSNDEVDARETKDSLDYLVSAGYDGIGDILRAKQRRLDFLEAKKRGLFSNKVSFAVPSAVSFLHGNCLYRLGRNSEAATQYQLAIRSDLANAKAWNNLINLYWEMKDFDQARTTLAKAEAAGLVIQPKLKQSVLQAR